MRPVFFFILFLSSSWTFAEGTNAAVSKEEWQETTLSDEVIHKIQAAQFSYKKCAADEMHKPENVKLEIRNATDVIIKRCEPALSETRKVYIDAQVPHIVADRQLKKLRIQVTRNVLQELMYSEAAKKAAHP